MVLAISIFSLHVFTLLQFSTAYRLPTTRRATPAQTAASTAGSVTLGSTIYVNQGLVGFGRIASNSTESTGDTLGGIGSAIAFKYGSWKEQSDGTYTGDKHDHRITGTLVVQPDRGFNVDGTINYQARRHELDFVLTPYSDGTDLSFAAAQKTLQLTYKNTTLVFERNNTKTSELDPAAIHARRIRGYDISKNGQSAMHNDTSVWAVVELCARAPPAAGGVSRASCPSTSPTTIHTAGWPLPSPSADL
ncbi:hypothetical protein C8R43DRAFT_1121169 [Mycena crocata]|nr:hypothetical protein C8R43DRAFT_1121169 [Mycena crocata]